MKKNHESGLDFIIDKITNSIENIVTGDSFSTEVSILTMKDISIASKKNGWLFNWKEEFMKLLETFSS